MLYNLKGRNLPDVVVITHNHKWVLEEVHYRLASFNNQWEEENSKEP